MDTQPFVAAFQEINNRLIRLIGAMSALRELSTLEPRHVDEQELLDTSLRILLDNHELDHAVIFLREDETLEARASRGWQAGAPLPDEAVMPLLSELAAEALARRAVCYRRETPGLPATEGSAIALPLASGDNPLGALCAWAPDSDFFTPSHERSLVIYCNFLAQSILNNRLLQQMDALVKARTEQLHDALSEAKELKRRYEELSVIDDLTALHNRRFFFPEARNLVAAAIRYETPMSILMVDIDRFKQINDTYGHATGDRVLKRMAELLHAEKREADILARFGGEEFIMLLPETAVEGATIFAERLRQKIADLDCVGDERPFRITASFGVASLSFPAGSDAGQVLETLVQQADAALYRSKADGRNRVSRYSDIGCAI